MVTKYDPAYSSLHPVPEAATSADTYDPFGLSTQLAQTMYAPTQIAQQQQNQSLLNQVGMLGPMYGLEKDWAKQQTGFDLSRLGLAGKDLSAQKALTAQLYGLGEAGADVNEGTLRRHEWESEDSLNRQLFASRRESAGAERDAIADAAVRGAVPAPGTGRAVTENRANLADTLSEGELQRSKLRGDLHDELTGLAISRQEASARNAYAQATLANQAKELGISRRELLAKLDYSLKKLNLDHLFKAEELYTAIGSSNVEQAQTAQEILMKAQEMSLGMTMDPVSKGFKVRSSATGGPTGLSPLPAGFDPRPADTSAGGHRGTHSKAAGAAAWDYPAPIGTPVAATVTGKVTRVKKLAKSYGWHVIIKGDDGHEYVYAHLSAFGSVKPGMRVEEGTFIGLSGSTGHSNGAHLHYEIR